MNWSVRRRQHEESTFWKRIFSTNSSSFGPLIARRVAREPWTFGELASCGRKSVYLDHCLSLYANVREPWNSNLEARSLPFHSHRLLLSCRAFLDSSWASFGIASSKLNPTVSGILPIPFQSLALFGIFCFKSPSLIYKCARCSSQSRRCTPPDSVCCSLSALSWSAWTSGCRSLFIWETSGSCARPGHQRGSFQASNCWSLCQSTCRLYCEHFLACGS